MLLLVGSGLADARAGREPYLYALVRRRDLRAALFKSSVASVANCLLLGILVDSICQWLILGISYPGPALVVGPVLILTPYAVARAFSNRLAHCFNKSL